MTSLLCQKEQSSREMAARTRVWLCAVDKGAVLFCPFYGVTPSTTKNYTFYLDLHFREGDQQDRERVRRLAGTGAYDGSGPGARQIDTGLRIPVHLSVGRIGAATQWSILDANFASHDLEGFTAGYYGKIIAGARLEPSDYRVRIEALQNIPELSDTSVLSTFTSARFNREPYKT